MESGAQAATAPPSESSAASAAPEPSGIAIACLQFTQTWGYGNIQSPLGSLTSQSATFEAWINTTAAPSGSQTIYLGPASPGCAPRISIDASSRLQVYWSPEGTGGGYYSQDTTPVADGTWHHVAVVFDEDVMTFYKDGNALDSISMTATQSATGYPQIGAGVGDATGFIGEIFDLRVWSQVRSADQIQAFRYGAVDGTLANDLSALVAQGLLVATQFSSGPPEAIINLVDATAGGLSSCAVTKSTLPALGVAQVTLSPYGYDAIFAVTQSGINSALVAWVNDQTPLALAYQYTDNSWGQLTWGDPTASYLFSGTLTQVDPSSGNAIDIITLRTGAGPQTVQYNLPFKNARFQILNWGALDVDLRSDEDAVWVFTFQVSLTGAPAGNVPAAVVEQTQQRFGGALPSGVSFHQIGLALSTATFVTMTDISGLETLSAAALQGLLTAYLSTIAPAPIVVYVAISDAASTPADPTYPPTHVDFCVSPFNQSYGVPTTGPSELDTLNYLMMSGGRTPPASVPNGFPFNWVMDVSTAGGAGIRRALLAQMICEQLSGILPTVVPTLTADASANAYAGAINVTPGPAGQFAIAPDPLGAFVASYAPPEQTPGNSTEHNFTTIFVEGTYSGGCSLFFGLDHTGAPNPTIFSLSGSCAFSGSFDYIYTGAPAQHSEIPTTTYSWYVEFQLQADLENDGQVDIIVGASDFSSPPVVASDPDTAWDKILDALSGQVVTYTDDVTSLRTTIQSQIIDQILPQLKKTLGSCTPFVFPGGDTFVFSNLLLSSGYDLVTTINYHD